MSLAKLNDDETFEAYLSRWPKELSHIPETIIESLAFEHNQQVVENPDVYDFERWRCRSAIFSNAEIASVRHFNDRELNGRGIAEEFYRSQRPRTPLFDWMLTNGTFPKPILIIENGANHDHIVPKRAGESLYEPYHIFEGQRRLSYLKYFIELGLPNFRNQHGVIIFRC